MNYETFADVVFELPRFIQRESTPERPAKAFGIVARYRQALHRSGPSGANVAIIRCPPDFTALVSCVDRTSINPRRGKRRGSRCLLLQTPLIKWEAAALCPRYMWLDASPQLPRQIAVSGEA
jgi:hypothetical protein